MFGINFNFVAPKLRIPGITKSMREKARVQIRNSARAFLRKVILNVPVDTGMAKGSLQPLGRFLRVAVPISPKSYRSDRSPSIGAQQQTFSFKNRGNQFGFTLEISVLHFMLNNYYKISTVASSPWYAIEKGEVAAMIYLNANRHKLNPRLRDHIIKSPGLFLPWQRYRST